MNNQDSVQELQQNIFDLTVDRNIHILAEHGWYISSQAGVKTVFDLAALYQAGQVVAADNIIKVFYSKNLIKVESYLIAHLSELAPIIAEGFTCHRSK